MGNHNNTHVSNGLDVEVKVTVTHPGGRSDLIHVDPSKTRNVPTKDGLVTVSVFDPECPDNEYPYESINLPSDYSVVIRKNEHGKPKLRRVKYGTLWQDVQDADNL